MQTSEFYDLVQQRGQVDTEDRARAATTAVLETLGETVSGGEAEDVATQLPDELATPIENADHDAAGYDRAAFVDRVGDRLRRTDLDPETAENHVRAVTDALAESLTQGELEDLKAQLEADLHPLFEDVDVDR